MKPTTFLSSAILIAMALLACNPEQKPQTDTPPVAEVSNKERPVIQFYFVPSLKKSLVHEQAETIIRFLNKETQLNFEAVIPENHQAMIEDFGSGKAQVGMMNTLSFVSAVKKHQVNARLRSIKYGESSYKGQIIANASKNINTIEDLNGKSFAFTNKNSTSGFFYPAKILLAKGVKPAKTVYAEQHDRVVEMVYRGMVDAGATFYSEPGADGSIRDARARLLDKYPDVAERVKVIEITEPIPNDPLVFGKDMSEEDIKRICLAMVKFSKTKEGKTLLTDLYGTEGFIECTNSDYESMLEAVEKSGFFGEQL